MDDKSHAPGKYSELAKRSEDLEIRELEHPDGLQQIEITLLDAEMFPFMKRLQEIMFSVGDIPDEFLKGLTANPHDVVAFDLNSFLSAFDKIKIRNNFVLDYVYNFDRHYGGEPLVYAREKTSSPIKSPDEYYERFLIPRVKTLLGNEPNSEDGIPYLSHLEFEKTPIGFFEFVLFCMTVRCFYLHLYSNYNARHYLLTKSGMSHFLEYKMGGIPPKEVEFLRSIKYSPKLRIVGSAAKVTLLTFEETIGFSFLHIYVKHPGIFQKTEDEIVFKNPTTRVF